MLLIILLAIFMTGKRGPLVFGIITVIVEYLFANKSKIQTRYLNYHWDVLLKELYL